MRIILIRHAAAIDRGTASSESKRYLTPKGRDFFRETARTLVKKGVKPDLILTSPLLRAVQTADILAESLLFRGPLEAVDELEPGFDRARLRKLLDRYQQVTELVLVGHEPDLSTVVADLLGLSTSFNFKKGSALRLNIVPKALERSAVFKWSASGGKLITSPEEAFNEYR